MDRSRETIGKTIARTVRGFETRRTKHGRKWVTVFLNEDTIVIALHACLTAAEKILSRTPAGADQVLEYHRRFANAPALLQKIKSVTGMEVRDTTVEVEPETGRVVQFLTTNTVGEEFPRASRGPLESRVPARVRSAGTKAVPVAKPIQPDLSSGADRPIRTTRNSR